MLYQKEDLEGFHLSPYQQRVWLFETKGYSVVVSGQLVIEGPLQLDKLKKTIETMWCRYEILRTAFRLFPGTALPVQVVSAEAECKFEWFNLDLTLISHSEQAKQHRNFIHTLTKTRFDFTKDRLLRLVLTTFSANHHILTLMLPGLYADAQTLNILINDIARGYAGSLQTLNVEVVQYPQFTQWVLDLLEDEEASNGLAYWRKQSNPSVLDQRLAFELYHKLEYAGFQVAAQSLNISEPSLIQLDSLVQKYGSTLKIGLLACWLILLWKASQQVITVLGVGYDGRKFEELLSCPGPMFKYLPLKVDLDNELNFVEILSKLQRLDEEANIYHEYFNWSDPAQTSDKDKEELTFFPFTFDFMTMPKVLSVEEINLSLAEVETHIEPFKLKLSFREQDRAIKGQIYFNSALYDSDSIAQLTRQLEVLLESILKNPLTPLGRLFVLDRAGQQQLINNFNKTTTSLAPHFQVIELFNRQAVRTPDALALVCEQSKLTYAQLNERSNRLGQYLQKSGIGPEKVVALYLERSTDMVVSILAVLKAGGVYLPIDPAQPSQGILYVLEHTQPALIITSSTLADRVPDTAFKMICLDKEESEIIKQSPCPPPVKVLASNLVYLLFTSGSTGRPKGVAIEHCHLATYVQQVRLRMALPEAGQYAMVSTFAADLANTVIFPALCFGGCLHIIPNECLTDPVILAEYMTTNQIDCLKIVPSHLKVLLEEAGAKILPRQRLILGGEASQWDLIDQLQGLVSQCEVYNHYGPTETTVGVLTYPVVFSDTKRNFCQTVPVGQPLPESRIYLLDHNLQPVPIWWPGELYIGGSTVGRGYYNQPDLTAERFLPDPYAQVSGSRMYKTGDLARFLPDGTVEFIGRVDTQVKIRGYRVELGEIERTLCQHPAIRQAVVSVQEHQRGEKYLEAYLIPQTSQELPDIQELRNFLSQFVPNYMVPASFVWLKQLPLNSNGKIDRSRLSQAVRLDYLKNSPYTPPKNVLEEVLVDLWCEALGATQAGVEDNFFELGGNSLIAIKIISRLRNTFKVEITPQALFDTLTISKLAQFLIFSETRPGQIMATARLIKEIEGMSEEEIKQLLEQEKDE